MRPSPALLLVTLLGCCWFPPKAEAGVFLKLGQTAKDVGEEIHEGARKIETGILNIFDRDESTRAPVPSVTLATKPDSESKHIIGAISRCAPGEALGPNGCRPVE